MPVLPRALEIQGEISAIRRDIHAHPEMGLEEVRTFALVAAKLREWGVDVTEGVGKTGLVGSILIKIQYYMLDEATAKLFALATDLTEVFVVSVLERENG